MIKHTKVTNEVLASILKSIDEAIHVVNTEGVTVFYNEVAARQDGLKIDEVIGKSLLTVYPSLNEKTSTLLKVLRTKQPIINQPQSYVNLYGKKIDTLNTTIPIFDHNEMIGAVEIGKDYSEIQALYERVLDLEKGMKRKKPKKKRVHFTIEDLKTVNPSFQKMKERAKKLAQSHSPVMVFGESGTGKELLVQGIHDASKRSGGPFIAQNCAAIPVTLLESILFGTAKGSYTGAIDRPGLFELANGGTLFLDELHGMPIDLQAKLLRVLEDGMVRRVGSSTNISVDVRVISAMNVHPFQAVEIGQLRHDLFFRLNVLSFELKPLRERKEDILFLSQHFIDLFNEVLNKQVLGLNEEVQTIFFHYKWPGNIRELKHTIEYMMNVSEERVLSIKDLPGLLKTAPPVEKHKKIEKTEHLSLKLNLESLEQDLISRALAITNGNIKQAAVLLEIPRQTLQYKLKKQRAE